MPGLIPRHQKSSRYAAIVGKTFPTRPAQLLVHPPIKSSHIPGFPPHILNRYLVRYGSSDNFFECKNGRQNPPKKMPEKTAGFYQNPPRDVQRPHPSRNRTETAQFAARKPNFCRGMLPGSARTWRDWDWVETGRSAPPIPFFQKSCCQ